MPDERRSLAASERAEFRPKLVVGLALIATSAMVSAAGIAKRFLTPTPPGPDLVWMAVSVVVLIAATGWTMLSIRTLPEPNDDCDRYGRHMLGLTFTLLVIGLCNATGTSVLALNGELGVSAEDLKRISAPKERDAAEAALKQARANVRAAGRELARAELTLKHAASELSASCLSPAGEACAAAHLASAEAERVRDDKRLALDDAEHEEREKQSSCEQGKRALFFLLSLSTMMALFGASFYIVNRVRGMRPHRTVTLLDDEDDTGGANTLRDSTVTRAVSQAGSSERSGASSESTAAKARNEAHAEPFDVHAFWSGAFFRVGEAVLFTFAFFWWIWTSNNHAYIVWLPMLALFVGMFVKTGEAIVFRLGMRVLFAIEALLPTAATIPKAAAARTPPAAPDRPSGPQRALQP